MIKLMNLFKRNSDLEKKNELTNLIHSIYRINSSNKFLMSGSLIKSNSQDIMDIKDLLKRREQVQELYSIFYLFSNLLGRKDLGVKTEKHDLDIIKKWLDQIQIDKILIQYGFSYLKETENAINNLNNKLYKQPVKKTISHYGYVIHCLMDEQIYNGSNINKNLLNAYEKLKDKIIALNGVNKVQVESELSSIFKNNNTGEDKIYLNVLGFNNNINVIYYFKNGKRLKIFRGLKSFDEFKKRFKNDLNELVEPIKQRAILLFDFETNPKSILQKLYQESNQINPKIIPFPFREIDNLIRQCNEFIKIEF